jgi:hypothetical protein
MTDPTDTPAAELVAQTRRELAEIAEAIRSHRFLERLRTRDVPEARLRALAGEQHAIVSSDRRSFAQLAARFPQSGSRADVVLAFLANLAAWGENCGKVAAALREVYG